MLKNILSAVVNVVLVPLGVLLLDAAGAFSAMFDVSVETPEAFAIGVVALIINRLVGLIPRPNKGNQGVST